MAKISTKQIKLQPKYRELSGRQKIVPWLNISGVWLEELGFKAGDMVRIVTRERLLVIEPLENDAQSEREYKAKLQDVKCVLKKIIE